MQIKSLIALVVFSGCCQGASAQQGDVTGLTRLAAIPHPLVLRATGEQASIGADTLTLPASKGTDLYANTDGSKTMDNTPRVLFAAPGDFIFSAKVDAQFNAAFDGGALIVYIDGQHWGKLLFERTMDGQNAISTTVTRTVGDDALHQMIAASQVYLKVARRGDVFVFYTSTDGVQWRMVRSFGLGAHAQVKLGFSSQSPLGPRFSARFSDVQFRAAAFKDYWQGK